MKTLLQSAPAHIRYASAVTHGTSLAPLGNAEEALAMAVFNRRHVTIRPALIADLTRELQAKVASLTPVTPRARIEAALVEWLRRGPRADEPRLHGPEEQSVRHWYDSERGID